MNAKTSIVIHANPVQPQLRRHLQALLQSWRETGVPPRWQLMNTLQELLEWRANQDIQGLWNPPPLLATATLDDGWGHGLEVIETCGRAAGLRIERLGLLISAEQIIDRCRQMRPQLLGLTLLQLDSEVSLRQITEELRGLTKVLVGGPPFRIDPELAARTQVGYVARDVADFLDFILNSNIVQL